VLTLSSPHLIFANQMEGIDLAPFQFATAVKLPFLPGISVFARFPNALLASLQATTTIPPRSRVILPYLAQCPWLFFCGRGHFIGRFVKSPVAKYDFHSGSSFYTFFFSAPTPQSPWIAPRPLAFPYSQKISETSPEFLPVSGNNRRCCFFFFPSGRLEKGRVSLSSLFNNRIPFFFLFASALPRGGFVDTRHDLSTPFQPDSHLRVTVVGTPRCVLVLNPLLFRPPFVLAPPLLNLFFQVMLLTPGPVCPRRASCPF